MAEKRSIVGKLLIVAVVLGAWTVYSNPGLMYKLGSGQFSEITKEIAKRAGDSLKSDMGSAVSKTAEKISGPQTVYKWQDRDGKWHYSSEPPVNIKELDVKVQEIDPNTNSIPSSALKGPAPAPSGKAARTNPPGANVNTSDPMDVSSYKDALEKAKAAREIMEQRNQDLDKVIK